MKTAQDWSFITKEKPLPAPPMQENKLFHALTSAYAKNKEIAVYEATENIMRREKELCKMALDDLGRLSGEKDETLGMIVSHYQGRLATASEKEERLKKLSEDSRKMNEEHKKKNQELAEIKRNLMESQAKLREMAKVTEKLAKKEEELRFIETHLREELDKNKREMLNGLYEIVGELSDGEGQPSIPEKAASTGLPTAGLEKTLAGLPEGFSNLRSGQSVLPTTPELRKVDPLKVRQLLERCQKLLVDPPKTACSKSLVKSPEGVVLCEYFFSANSDQDSRHYIFNTVFSLHYLLDCLEKDSETFIPRLELSLSDLSSRLSHAQNIHLEAVCKDIFNRETLGRLLALNLPEKPAAFADLAEKCIQRFEALGPKRPELIVGQFQTI